MSPPPTFYVVYCAAALTAAIAGLAASILRWYNHKHQKTMTLHQSNYVIIARPGHTAAGIVVSQDAAGRITDALNKTDQDKTWQVVSGPAAAWELELEIAANE